MTTTPHLGLTKDSPTGEKYSVVRVNDNSDRIDEYCYENRTRIVALETAQEQMAGDLADKIEIGDVFGIPKDITAGDLDDLTEIGIHQTDDAGAAALAHSPITTGFYLRVFVMELATNTWYRQELVPKNAPRVTYMRHLHVGVGWTEWQHTGILDSTPTENSTNPVTSGGVAESQAKQDAEIAWAVNSGVKNLVELDSATYTSGNVSVEISADGTVSVSLTSGSTASTTFARAIKNITSLRDRDLILTGCPPIGGSYSSGYALYISDDGATKEKDEGSGVLVPKSTSVVSSQLAIIVRSGTTISGTLEFKPMLRPAEIKDATFCKYAPSNRELYEMILALQNGGNRSLSMRTAEPEEKEVETDAGNSDQNQR